ncbi:acyl-CoA dehydrogenase [Rhizohabitans arisaemae]|uniref:acyl-CoA dehydrogenase n=1 Tax=Rhizohabitans arisaemae TaxID=2720610 RepID=UPI0024B1B484|nr:acyl-CoA dehydrogenase [Rhizohabitans arisaemae]
MAIGLSEEHEALRDSVRGWAERNIPATAVRAAVDAADAAEETRPAFWQGLADQGLLGLHLPEEYGGQGYGLLELAVAVEQLARVAAPGPYLPTVLASAVLLASESGCRDSLLPGLADGSGTAAVALTSDLVGERRDGSLVIDGVASPVLGGALADLLILPVNVGETEVWVVVDAAGAEVTRLGGLDLTRGVASVTVRALPVPADRLLTGVNWDEVGDLAAILFGAEAAGVAGWCVRAAADYAKVREQFGRPIGQFQGVKHKAASMLIELEQARAVVWDAARAADGAGAPEASFTAATAALVAVDAGVRCGADAIQIFGGIGYTWEHDAHLYYRRALSLRALLGQSQEWAAAVGSMAVSGVVRTLTVDLPPEAEAIRDGIRAELAEIAALPTQRRPAALGDGGWGMPHLPKPWGRGASPLEQVLIDTELRAAGLTPPALVIGAWVVPSIVAFGTAEQQERFLPATLRGELAWCQLFSEPEAGSDLAGLKTTATKTAGGWRLTGQKIWTSVAQTAEWGICLARTDPARPKHKGITYFLVDMRAPGVRVSPLTEITGETLFNEVFLDDVFVPDDLVLGAVDDGWRVARNTLSNERVLLSSGTSTAGVSLADLVALAAERPLTPIELVEVGRVAAEGHAIAALGLRVTLRQLSGGEPGADGSIRKLLGMWHAQRVAETGWSLLGPEAALDRAGGRADRWSRGVLASRAMTIYGGTTEVQLNIVGERLLGLPRDPEPGR